MSSSRTTLKLSGPVAMLLQLRAMHENRRFSSALEVTIIEKLSGSKYKTGPQINFLIAEFNTLTADLSKDLKPKVVEVNGPILNLIRTRSREEIRTFSSAAEVTILEALLPVYGEMLYAELGLDLSEETQE